jgi:3-hydroxyisobutyrate dehydrogenase/2-hydroxy-3-oxopropionate reductase
VTRVAFLGLGKMGLPMAGRLLDAGHDLRVWNRTLGKAEGLVARGAVGAASAAEAARDAEIVITMLADPAALVEVVFGRDGIADSIDPEAFLIDMSTVGPTAIRAVAERLGEVRVLDAPVLGSVPHAEAGSLVILVGGEQQTVSRCTEVLEAMGTIQHVGPSGAGATAKLASNAAVMSTIVSLGEALSLSDRLGANPTTVLDAIGSGPLASFVERFRGKLTDGAGRTDFRLVLARKDLALAVEEAQALGLDLTHLRAAIARCDEAIAAGLGDDDNTSVTRYLRSSR